MSQEDNRRGRTTSAFRPTGWTRHGAGHQTRHSKPTIAADHAHAVATGEPNVDFDEDLDALLAPMRIEQKLTPEASERIRVGVLANDFFDPDRSSPNIDIGAPFGSTSWITQHPSRPRRHVVLNSAAVLIVVGLLGLGVFLANSSQGATTEPVAPAFTLANETTLDTIDDEVSDDEADQVDNEEDATTDPDAMAEDPQNESGDDAGIVDDSDELAEDNGDDPVIDLDDQHDDDEIDEVDGDETDDEVDDEPDDDGELDPGPTPDGVLCLDQTRVASADGCQSLTQVEFHRIVDEATQACTAAAGRDGETVHVLGRSYTIYDLGQRLSEGRHTGNLLAGDNDNNILIGTAEDDQLRGEFGDDILCGGGGDDLLFGWGAATLMPGDGADVLIGGPGQDVLQGGFGSDILVGEGGDFAPGSPKAPLWGHEAQDDAIDHCQPYDPSRSHGCDPLIGGQNSLRTPTGEQDTVSPPTDKNGELPPEFVDAVAIAVEACETFSGRHGDTVTFNGVTYLVVELSRVDPSAIEDGLPIYRDDIIQGMHQSNIIIGTPNSEGIGGFDGDDLICGYGGNDSIAGNKGDDVLIGGLGNDNFTGGAGDDIIAADDADMRPILGGLPVRGGLGNDYCFPTHQTYVVDCNEDLAD